VPFVPVEAGGFGIVIAAGFFCVRSVVLRWLAYQTRKLEHAERKLAIRAAGTSAIYIRTSEVEQIIVTAPMVLSVGIAVADKHNVDSGSRAA
jgi:hypothetical protein